MASRPLQLAGSRSQPLQYDEQRVRQHGQRNRQHRAGDVQRREELAQPVLYQEPQAADTDQRCDGHQADRCHGRDAQAGDDDRQRQWQLDPP